VNEPSEHICGMVLPSGRVILPRDCAACVEERALARWLRERRPMNWDEMGASAKDLWEERMTRSFYKSRGGAA